MQYLRLRWRKRGRMKTSYFFSNRIRTPGLNLVAISNSYPKKLEWLKTMRRYPALCPGWTLVKSYKNNEIRQDEYVVAYIETILDRLDPFQVYAGMGDDAILLCWEKPGLFCHRRIVAEWFKKHLGIKVNEL